MLLHPVNRIPAQCSAPRNRISTLVSYLYRQLFLLFTNFESPYSIGCHIQCYVMNKQQCISKPHLPYPVVARNSRVYPRKLKTHGLVVTHKQRWSRPHPSIWPCLGREMINGRRFHQSETGDSMEKQNILLRSTLISPALA